METANAVTTLNGANGQAHALNPTCPSKKKCFATREEAEIFEANNRAKYPGQPRQYVYACEDCPDWHLSSQDPATFAMSASRTNSSLSNLEAKMPAKTHGRLNLEDRAQRIRDVEKLRSAYPHARVSELAEKLAPSWGISVDSTYGWIYNHLNPQTEKPSPVNLDTIAAKRKFLEEQLKSLIAEEQKLIELKALKLMFCWDGKGVLIKKENSQIALSLEDAQELVGKLTEFLTQPAV